MVFKLRSEIRLFIIFLSIILMPINYTRLPDTIRKCSGCGIFGGGASEKAGKAASTLRIA